MVEPSTRENVDVFSIKKRNGQTLYIRCLDLYKSQPQLSLFIERFTKKIDNLNNQIFPTDNKIEMAPSIYERKIGRIYAVVMFIALIFLTYILKTQGLGSKPSYKIVFVYVGGFIWIGMPLAFYILSSKKKEN